MANASNQFPIRSLNNGMIPVFGSFAPNGSSAVDATSRLGKGWSVARTSAGLFTITFANVWAEMVSFTCSLQLATAADQFLIPGVYTAASKTITITVWDISGAAATDVSANANNRIHFCAWFRNSAVPPSYG